MNSIIRYIWNESKKREKLNSDQQWIQPSWSLFFVPKRTMVCEKALEEAGVYGDITIGEYPLDLVPFEADLLSLEQPLSFKELYVVSESYPYLKKVQI